MSVEEDTELRDLVSQTLESKGVLSKIRAELRASVFLALEEQDVFKEKASFVNKPLKEFVSSTEGAMVASLVREFLEFFGLEFTAAVFEPETQAGKDYECLGRSKLACELKLTPGKKLPLLSHIVQDFRTKGDLIEKNIKINNVKTKEEKQEKNSKNMNSTARIENGFFQNVINGQMKSSDSFSTIIKDNINSEKSSVLNPLTITTNQNATKKPDSLKLDLTPLSIKPLGNSLSSLEGLPPLGLSTNGQRVKDTTQKNSNEVTSDIKALLNLELDAQDKYYEEDFHSSASDKTKPGRNHSPSGSVSEVEEEILSTGEDQLNSSLSIGLDDHTADWSGSNNSNKDKLGDNLLNL